MKLHNLLLLSAAVLFGTASLSATTIPQTWVSGSGNDNNNCTFTAPCATFQIALENTNAGGMVIAKDAGSFGPLLINQSVTIDGNNLGSIAFDAIGVQIVGGANVTLQNLTINGLGTGGDGIDVEYGGLVTVDNCKIMNFTVDGIHFKGAGNLTVENSRIESFITSYVNGIFVDGNLAEFVVVKNTVIDASPQANDNTGFFVNSGAGAVSASLQNVTIMGAGSEAISTDSGAAQITGSVITQSYYGISAQYGATVSVADSLITSNAIGVCSYASSKIRLDNNDIYDNPTAIANCGGIVKTSTTNKTSGTIAIPASDVSESVTF